MQKPMILRPSDPGPQVYYLVASVRSLRAVRQLQRRRSGRAA